jgi:hypothetical protein
MRSPKSTDCQAGISISSTITCSAMPASPPRCSMGSRVCGACGRPRPRCHQLQNLNRDYDAAIRRLHDHGVMVNGRFVFGMDSDDPDVFERTVDWAISQGIETATFHILTPYPGTARPRSARSATRCGTSRMRAAGRNSSRFGIS